MNLSTLAILNIKRNLRNYAMYFFSMCFCVFTTYSFANLALSKTVFAKLTTSYNFKNIFTGFGIAIIVFVVFFLVSSNKSFIRFRKKEISTYALFGMENSRIGKLLFIETMIIGTAALITGILFGVIFSKLLSMVLLKMIMVDYVNISFKIEIVALAITIVVYLFIFCIMGVSGIFVINRFQLVDLFKGDRVAEKQSKGSILLLLLSIALIVLGYILAINDNSSNVANNMILIIILVVVGSYLFYIGGINRLLYLIKKNKNYLYMRTRLISISMISHKSRTMATTMGTIAILIAASTTTLAFGHTLYRSAETNAKENTMFDVWYYVDNEELDKQVSDLIEKNKSKITDIVKLNRYVSTPIIDNLKEGDSESFTNLIAHSRTYMESEYNRIVDASRATSTNVSVDKGTLKVLYPYHFHISNNYKGTVKYGNNIFNLEFEEAYTTYSYGSYLTIVLNDEDYNKIFNEGYILDNNDGSKLFPFTAINYTSALSKRQLANDLKNLLNKNDSISYSIMFHNYIEILEIFGLLCFIGFFICIVLILMSVSILYFKQIALGTEETSQFIMLRKIGMDNDEEKMVIKKRIAPIFFIPFLMGLLHSLFAMKGADSLIFSNIIHTKGSTYLQVLKTSLVMYIIYLIVYSFFYLITKYQYSKVVRN